MGIGYPQDTLSIQIGPYGPYRSQLGDKGVGCQVGASAKKSGDASRRTTLSGDRQNDDTPEGTPATVAT